MITYGLGIITYPSTDEPSSTEIPGVNISISLTKEEYDQMQSAILKVGGIYTYADMFSTTRWNYEDLVNTIRAYLQAFIQKDARFLTARDISLNINKDVLNVLTSFRFYVDYMDKRLSSDFDKASELVSKFESYKSKEYDSNFSYRLVYHLRNYAQHKGLVVNSINFGKFLDEENQSQVRYHFKINISRDDLLEDKNFKKELKVEIKNLPKGIDLMEHISKWMGSLAKIHDQIMCEIIPTGLEDAKFIVASAGKLSYASNNKNIIPALFATDHSEKDVKEIKNINHIPLPIENAQQIIEYCETQK